MGFSFNVNLGGFVDEVAAVDPHLPVRVLQPLATAATTGASPNGSDLHT
jgi:hypothetical protein